MNTVPQRLDKYELVERLGHGGIAEVWKAFDTQLQRFVALKLLHPDLHNDSTFLARFQREAQLVANLHHPNIIPIHDFQIWQPPGPDAKNQTIAYMVMDYIEGTTLADYLRRSSGSGQMPAPAEVVNLFTAISLAVDYAHRQGMIHRDIKPANILLDQHNTTRNPMGEPILTDFGIARLLDSSATLQTGIQFGTPGYISPEQIKGEPGTERSDIYALGVILYEIATGVLPFNGDTPVDIMAQHLNVVPLVPSLINPHLPPALVQVIMRALAKDPAQRFASASSMTAAIARALQVPIPEILGLPSQPLDRITSPTLQMNMPSAAPATPILHSLSGISSSPTQTPADQHPLVATPSAPATPATVIAGPATPVPATPLPDGKRPRKGLIILAVLLLPALILGGLGVWLVPRIFSPTSPIVGQAFYTSSGQIKPGTARGMMDQIQIDLQNISAPHIGNSYYVWLLADKTPKKFDQLSESKAIKTPLLLTNNLVIKNGRVHYVFPGTATHDNLLAVTSRLLITEEQSGRTTGGPSTDRSTWRYFAEIPQQPITGTQLSALDHIRHLLYNELRANAIDIPGGADFWLTRNTEKVLELAVAARDSWYGADTSQGQISQMHDHFIRILDFLDGLQNVHVDLPANTPALISAEDSKGALLTVDPLRQSAANLANPPGHLDHVQFHVAQVARATGLPQETRLQTSTVLDALKNAKNWLSQVRTLAVSLYKTASQTPDQMRSTETGKSLDKLVTNAMYAYIGQLDPTTQTVQAGVIQAHYAMQQLTILSLSRELPNSL